MIEELHHPLKSAIKCHSTERWTEVLPIILLGLRASLKDILCTPAELVFGTTIRLPGEMFDSSKPDDDVVNFVSKLKSHMQSVHSKPPKHHGKRPVFIHPGLLEATHVFLRRDMLRRPLQQPYDGPFKVLQRKDKVFFLDINGKRVSVSIDRCKPAFFLITEDLQLPQTKNETPATVEPNATAPTPATVEHDPTASTPTQPSTRSGRKVHLPSRNSVRGYDEEESNDEEYKSKYDSSTEIDPDSEEGDTLRVLVAALWDKKLAFRTRERRKILDFYGRTATQGEKEIFGRAVLRFNSASEKESVLLIEDQTDL
ncbi:integrase catalytic domain-containing protein [Trichonephila clavipes]|nr:integrase catalytic domain-containing protein [Trichonephila clavipes]